MPPRRSSVVVGAFLDDAAVVHDDEAIHGGNRRQAMSDGDHRLAFHESVEIFLDGRFDFRIERAGCLIEHQDRRILEQHAGDGDALALAAGEFHAALADMGLDSPCGLADLPSRR